MTGNGGANVLTGLAGNDKIVAGLGADMIIGGVGKDSVTGGGDADTFVFAEFGSANADTIADFVHGQDKISLSSGAFGLAAGTLPDAIFAQGTAATTAAQRILYDQVKGDIWYDPDGSGAAAKQLVASLTDGLAITSSDFLIF
jgi:Ca2+-binding RTX toxin-like protein